MSAKELAALRASNKKLTAALVSCRDERDELILRAKAAEARLAEEKASRDSDERRSELIQALNWIADEALRIKENNIITRYKLTSVCPPSWQCSGDHCLNDDLIYIGHRVHNILSHLGDIPKRQLIVGTRETSRGKMK